MADFIYAGDGGAFKICGTCREIKSLRDFARKNSTLDGMRHACRECENAPRRLDGLAVGSEMLCAGCGAAIVKTAPGKKFCDDCVRLRHNERTLYAYYESCAAAGKVNVGSIIKCVDCATEVKYDGGRHKRCAPCQKYFRDNRHFLESGREPNHKPLGDFVACENCGDDFERTAHNGRFCCKECYHDADVAARKDRHYRHRVKRRVDPHYIISSRVASGMRASLKGGKDGYSWEKIVGYSRFQLATCLERQFSRGMSWNNMDEWEIDHIIPKSSFKYETYDCDEFRAAWAITNLRPLWTEDNRKKSAKMEFLV